MSNELPEDLGIKIGTDLQIIWENVEKETKKTLEELKKAIIINEGILETAKKKIAEEIEKLK